jgi:diguanylate cyclase (GGDEF)-like protein
MNDRGEREKLLVVDDEPGNIRALNETLRDNYLISSALNGREALRVAARIQPDLVLLDIRMPEMDGYEVCRIMQDDPLLCRIPIIFVTALSGEEDESIGLALGAVDYIIKPFRPAIVKQRISIHLELKRQRDQLSRQSRADGLTGIPNRRAFDERLDLEWRRAIRSRERLSLAMIDIDRFKEFNDTYGHLAGDDCLRRVAQSLNETLNRAGDFVGRYGGEEFTCILPGVDEPGLPTITEKVRATIESLGIPHETSGVSPYVTISIGAACCTPTLETAPELLIGLADEQLYRSKSQGRNRVCVLTR